MSSHTLGFDLPFIPDEGYAATLLEEFGPGLARVRCLHFSLHDACAPDSRHATFEVGARSLAELLSGLPGPRKYALLNARFHDTRAYAPQGLRPVVERLETLLAAGVLHGVIWSDAYLLQALGGFSPALAASLEAVPSINTGPDSVGKILSCLDLAASAGFRQPSKLCLDRSLNRDMRRLAEVAADCRRELPEAELHLLANEGCLRQCPFRPAHEAHIALSRFGPEACRQASGGLTELNRELGCIRLFFAEPWRILASPFIRPEDAGAYAGVVDGLKLCGRTRGPGTMAAIVRAYSRGSFQGNLLRLMDAMEGLFQAMHVGNAELPRGFHATVAACRGRCAACGYCAGLAASVIVKGRISLEKDC